MIGFNFLKVSMTTLLSHMLYIRLDCEDAQAEQERFYDRY